jgi:hypothetical protein
MLLRTKLHGKTYELLETGGLDTPFATNAQGYSTTDLTSGREDSFIFPSLFFVPFVPFVVKK